MSETDILQPGAQLDGRYEVVRLVGQGGMATVYQVRHLGLHSVHALKVLAPELARNDELRARFLAEGRIQAQLRHPNIVQVTEIVTSPVAGLVMDYVEGPTLAGFCQGKGPLDVKTVLDVFLPVLDAVDEAHKAHVVHRDLKPENIILGKDSRGRLQPKVTDFGIAKLLRDEESAAPKQRTRAGARLGTLLYMSPEQVRGADEVDPRADIFSLGAILYEVVTGKLAFDAPSDYDTMRNIVQGTFEPPERVVGGLPPVIAGCIRKALAVDPAERFQDCAAFRAALETALDAEPKVPARPVRSFAVTRPGTVSVNELSAVLQSVPPPAAKAPEAAPAEPSPTHGRLLRPGEAPPPVRLAPPVLPRPAPMAQAPRAALPPLPPKSISPDPRTSPVLALLLSLLCVSGLGQLYNSQVAKGFFIILLNLVSWCVLPGAGWLTLNILFAVDAYMIASKRQRGLSVGSWETF